MLLDSGLSSYNQAKLVRCCFLEIRAGKHGFERACDELSEEVSPERPLEQTQLIEFILSKCTLDPKRAAETLCIVACDLEDANLWEKAIMACCPTLGVATISNELKHEAIENFGFEAVRPR